MAEEKEITPERAREILAENEEMKTDIKAVASFVKGIQEMLGDNPMSKIPGLSPSIS